MREKTLHNSDISEDKKNVPDIKVFGDGALFKLLSKASSEEEGWMKSTKAMEIPGAGCVVQVTTQQRNPGGGYVVAEALTFVPGVGIVTEYGPEDQVLKRYLSLDLTLRDAPKSPSGSVRGLVDRVNEIHNSKPDRSFVDDAGMKNADVTPRSPSE